MVVTVTVQFFDEPSDEERQDLLAAAWNLTKDRNTVSVLPGIESENTLIAVFKMKNEAQYKAIERVWPQFARHTLSRDHMAVRFEQEKAYAIRARARVESKRRKTSNKKVNRTGERWC